VQSHFTVQLPKHIQRWRP